MQHECLRDHAQCTHALQPRTLVGGTALIAYRGVVLQVGAGGGFEQVIGAGTGPAGPAMTSLMSVAKHPIICTRIFGLKYFLAVRRRFYCTSAWNWELPLHHSLSVCVLDILRGNQLSWFSWLSLLQCVGTQCMSLAPLETRMIVISHYHWFSLGTSGSQRLPVVIYGYQWFSVVIYGSQWLSMVIYGYQWFSMAISGYQWLCMVTSGSQWLPVVIYGFQWLSVVTSGYLWFSVVISGYQWFSVVLSGYQWFSVITSGYLWLSVVINGSQWFSVVTSGYLWFSVVISGSQ